MVMNGESFDDTNIVNNLEKTKFFDAI